MPRLHHARGLVLLLLFVPELFLLANPRRSAAAEAREAEMSGYLLVPNEKVPETFNGGFSMYVAAWPLLENYPGHRFQTGLFGTWMFAQKDPHADPVAAKKYSDVEGGLGWWRDTRFPSETPKFIMGGVGPEFSEIANGPAHGAGDWKKPRGLYGVAQLSPWVLFPIDGLNLKQGTCGQLFGYGYLPLPLTPAKPTTDGQNIPTGENCWTLFLNTSNFKGPVAFFTPHFWSHGSVTHPELAGMLLDSRPSEPNRALQMETQYVPASEGTDSKGDTWARVAPTQFPRNAGNDSVLVHRVTSYNKSALWDSVKTWFDGGPAASGAIDPHGSVLHTFPGHGGSTWQIYAPRTPRDQKIRTDWKPFATPTALDPTTYGYHWNFDLVQKTDTKSGPLVTLPQYFHLIQDKNSKSHWQPVRADEVPPETGLAKVEFTRPHERPQDPYTTPDAPDSVWKKPGPAAGPFQARLGDGSTVTYSWYRFADQPAILHAGLTDAERESLQKKVEQLHRSWTKDRNYLPPPTVGSLADLDPALIVTPPKGLEVGYVPIATRQTSSD
ncbi:MAG TPA: hypothetical protein VLJ39_22900 [Tepidisphaeraceae bacterium]|nr:hypothetical protein [Tepidisphaeraceae bacterium]